MFRGITLNSWPSSLHLSNAEINIISAPGGFSQSNKMIGVGINTSHALLTKEEEKKNQIGSEL